MLATAALRHRSYQRLFIGWKNEFRAQPEENKREKRARFSHADTYRASLTTSEADARTAKSNGTRGQITRLFHTRVFILPSPIRHAPHPPAR